MKSVAVLLMCFLLAGCPGTTPRRADIPVSVGCLARVPSRPYLIFESLPAPKTDAEAADQVRVLWKEREAAINYGIQWEAAAAGCNVVREEL
jgi:hypothetical protein